MSFRKSLNINPKEVIGCIDMNKDLYWGIVNPGD